MNLSHSNASHPSPSHIRTHHIRPRYIQSQVIRTAPDRVPPVCKKWVLMECPCTANTCKKRHYYISDAERDAMVCYIPPPITLSILPYIPSVIFPSIEFRPLYRSKDQFSKKCQYSKNQFSKKMSVQ